LDRRSTTNVVFFTFLILATTACGSSEEIEPVILTAGSQASDLFGLEPCEYELGDNVYVANCGKLVVPKNRENPDTKLIALPITRIRAKQRTMFLWGWRFG
jgi:hypothetical protein